MDYSTKCMEHPQAKDLLERFKEVGTDREKFGCGSGFKSFVAFEGLTEREYTAIKEYEKGCH